MSVPVRLICDECLRSIEWQPSNGSTPPTSCTHCGTELSGRWEDELVSEDREATPISLALTPEEERSLWGERTASSLPELLGRFQLRELLGGGGFGQVYLAYDPRLDREVALKVLRDEQPTSRVVERFFREARTAARLSHPNIVALHDAGRTGGRCWIAYEYVSGSNLARFGEGRAVRPEAAARIALGLAEALDHAHGRGVYHRDLKPANIIIDALGQPRLTDFGLARRAGFDPTLTGEGAILGTPAYMSPEQAAGRSHEADARSDLYSLGVVFYELLCGRRPFDSTSRLPLWQARDPVTEALIPPRVRLKSVPVTLDRICQRALADDPADRYPDAGSLATDLRRWLDRPRHMPKLLMATALSLSAFALTLERPGLSPSRSTSNEPIQEPQEDPPPRLRVVPISQTAYEGNAGSRLFHRVGCRGLKTTSREPRLQWPDLADALESGRFPCRLCVPGEHP